MKKNKKSITFTIGLVLLVAMLSWGSYEIIRENRNGNSTQAGMSAVPGGAGPGGRGPGTGTNNPSQTAQGTAVQLHTVETGTVSSYIRTNGEVAIATEVELFSHVDGLVVSYPIQVGDFVLEGQTIARIDSSRPGESYALSPVVASVSGTVISAPLSRGNKASTMSPVAVIGDLGNIRIRTAVPESYSGIIEIGSQALLSFPAFPDEQLQGTVTFIAPVLDPETRTLALEINLSTEDPRVKPGMYADIRLVSIRKEGVVLVPRETVLTYFGEKTVFVVDDSNRAERRIIETGIQGRDAIEVISGLGSGETVVLRGQNFLDDGDQVRVVGSHNRDTI